MVAIGVGGADAVDVMTGFPWNVRWPKVIGVRLTGTLSGWSSPKDVILEVARLLTVEGGTGAIVEYFGPGADSISATGKAHDLQHGRRDRRHHVDLRVRRQHVGVPQGHRSRSDRRRRRQGRRRPAARRRRALRPADRDRPRPAQAADQRPALPRPRPPRRRRRRRRPGARERLAARGVGGADRVVHQLVVRRHHPRRIDRPPSSCQGPRPPRPSCSSRRAPSRSGRRSSATACWPTSRRSAPPCSPNACGPCIGQWSRPASITGQPNTIVNSYNRNFPKRNDGSCQHAVVRHVARHRDGDRARRPARLRPHDRHDHRARRHRGQARPTRRRGPPRRRATTPATNTFTAPPGRLERRRRRWSARPATDCSCSQPFPAWDGNDYIDLPMLMKAQGKCTTDHISAAGPWLKYRGHLENISGNLFARRRQRLHRRDRRPGVDITDGEHAAVSRDRQALPRGRHPVGGDRRPQLRRGLVARARRDGAAVPRRRRDPRPLVRPHPRDQRQEAGPAAAHVRRPRHVRRRSASTTGSTCSTCRRCPAATCAARSSSPTAPSSTSRPRHTFSDEQVEWFKAGSALNIVRAKVAAG